MSIDIIYDGQHFTESRICMFFQKSGFGPWVCHQLLISGHCLIGKMIDLFSVLTDRSSILQVSGKRCDTFRPTRIKVNFYLGRYLLFLLNVIAQMHNITDYCLF